MQGGVLLFRLMKSLALRSFWRSYRSLPVEVQKAAIKQYKLWLQTPHHSSLHFKKVGCHWSARVTDDYRAVGIREENTIIWYFIGTHAEYNKLLKKK